MDSSANQINERQGFKTLVAFKLVRVTVSCRNCGSRHFYSEGVRAEIFSPPSRKHLTADNVEELMRICPQAPRRTIEIQRSVDYCTECWEEKPGGIAYPLGLRLEPSISEAAREQLRLKKKKEAEAKELVKEAQRLLDELF